MVGSDIHKQNRQRTMTVIGIYDIGIPSMEKATSYISLTEAQNLFGLHGQSTEVQITLKRVGTESAVVNALTPLFPGYEVESWAKNYPELSNAVGRKNIVMDIFSVIIVMIAGIGILNLLLMAIYERTREIGLLGAMGLKPRQIATTFILEGALIGFVGVIAGIALGLAHQSQPDAGWHGLQPVRGCYRLHGSHQRQDLSHTGHRQTTYARHHHFCDRRPRRTDPSLDRIQARAV